MKYEPLGEFNQVNAKRTAFKTEWASPALGLVTPQPSLGMSGGRMAWSKKRTTRPSIGILRPSREHCGWMADHFQADWWGLAVIRNRRSQAGNPELGTEAFTG